MSPVLERFFGWFAGCTHTRERRRSRRTLFSLGGIQQLVRFFAAHLTRLTRLIAGLGALGRRLSAVWRRLVLRGAAAIRFRRRLLGLRLRLPLILRRRILVLLLLQILYFAFDQITVEFAVRITGSQLQRGLIGLHGFRPFLQRFLRSGLFAALPRAIQGIAKIIVSILLIAESFRIARGRAFD